MVRVRDASALVLFPVLLPLILLSLGTAALAQPRKPALSKARQLFKRAEVHFSLGEFEQALTLYKDAYRSKQLPEFLFNIGQCYRHQGRCKQAVFHFRQFLLHQPDAPENQQVRRLIGECELALAAEQKRKEQQQAAAAAAAADCPPCRGDPGPRVSRAWFWGGLGVTTALLGTAAATAALAGSDNKKYLDPATPVETRQELKDRGEALELASWTCFGAGVAALGGTVALYFLSRPASGAAGTRGERALSLAPLPGGGGVQLRGRF